MEWVHSQPPWIIKGEIEVWSTRWGLRSANVIPTLDPVNLFFTDCNHAAQNAYCNRNDVTAWRYKDQ